MFLRLAILLYFLAVPVQIAAVAFGLDHWLSAPLAADLLLALALGGLPVIGALLAAAGAAAAWGWALPLAATLFLAPFLMTLTAALWDAWAARTARSARLRHC